MQWWVRDSRACCRPIISFYLGSNGRGARNRVWDRLAYLSRGDCVLSDLPPPTRPEPAQSVQTNWLITYYLYYVCLEPIIIIIFKTKEDYSKNLHQTKIIFLQSPGNYFEFENCNVNNCLLTKIYYNLTGNEFYIPQTAR